jgi:hypothetical protein
MSSTKQLAANRANAQSSTGPRTPEGKSRSSQNARQHGFTADEFSVITIEDRDAVERLRADLLTLYQPLNSQELFAVERIALAQHTLLRLARLETGLCSVALNRAYGLRGEEPYIHTHDDTPGLDPEHVEMMSRIHCFADGFHGMTSGGPSWSIFLRYQAQAERQYRRAIDELERLQQLRPNFPNEPILEAQPQQITTTSPPENEPIFGPSNAPLRET